MKSDLKILKNCNNLLVKKTINLERDQLISSQYLRRESLEINFVPVEIEDSELEEKVCIALRLSGQPVSPSDLSAVHRLKSKNRVIVRFKNRKLRNEVFSKRKETQNYPQRAD